MTYKQWVEMNLNYELRLLVRAKDKYGSFSKEYKRKLKQIEDLKNGNVSYER